MIREQAIKFLELDKEDRGKCFISDAIDMAIKALETLEEFEKAQIITGGRLNGRAYAYKCGLEDGKRKALEQEPKKGHWIPVYQGDEIIDYRCSECEFGNTFGRGTFGMNFWPKCGSDNREVVEECQEKKQ